MTRWMICACVLVAGGWAATAEAAYRDLMGYPELQALLGSDIPTGAGIIVHHVEAGTVYAPPPAEGEFKTPDKHFSYESGPTGDSSHANHVGINFYGNDTSIAPDLGVTAANPIRNYQVNHWLNDGLLNAGGPAPHTTDARIGLHAWVASTGDAGTDGQLLRRFDYTVDHDDFVQIVGIPNGDTSGDGPLLKSAYNDIAVGRTDAFHKAGTPAVDGIYDDNRVAPTLVAVGLSKNDSERQTSYAAAQVAAGAALLMEAARNPALSNGTYTNRTRTIHHAEASEVTRALLMAGADRHVINARGGSITTYTADTNDNLSSTYGAGQMNIHNSYRMLAAGEQDSTQDGGPADVQRLGWDYDPSFGAPSGSNATASYFIEAGDTAHTLIASLVWNIDVIDVGTTSFIPAADLRNLDLRLIDVTAGGTVEADSLSTEHNSENIWFENIIPGHRYELRVTDGGSHSGDYAIAWHMIPEPATVGVLSMLSLTLIRRRRRR